MNASSPWRWLYAIVRALAKNYGVLELVTVGVRVVVAVGVRVVVAVGVRVVVAVGVRVVVAVGVRVGRFKFVFGKQSLLLLPQ